MVRPASRECEKFVDAVYRRLIFFHVIEQLGLGFLSASALTIVIDLLALWQSMPTQPMVFLGGGLGLLIGITLSIYRWPTRRSAVLETDRQLHFDDLLASAVFTTNQSDNDFAMMVGAMADSRCRQHAPGDVFFRRLNIQTWGGISVAIAIAFTLCAMPIGVPRSHAMGANSEALIGGETEEGKSIPRTNNATSESAWNAATGSQMEQVPDGKSKSGDANQSGEKDSGGSGGGGTTDLNSLRNPQKFDRNGTGDRGDVGALAGGGGDARGNNLSHENPAGFQGSNNRASKMVPDWHADSTSSHVLPGSQSTATSHIPSENADLIRDFFKPR